MFPLKNLARKGLIDSGLQSQLRQSAEVLEAVLHVIGLFATVD